MSSGLSGARLGAARDRQRDPATRRLAIWPQTYETVLMAGRVLWNVPCTAHRTTDGLPCNAWSVRGATVCRVHGGMAPWVRRAAAARIELLETARRMNADPARLAQVIGWEYGLRTRMRDLIEQVEQETGRWT